MPNALSADNSPAEQFEDPINVRSSQSDWSWPRFLRNAAVIVGLGILIVVVLRDAVIPNLIPKRFGEVESGELYRSGALTPAATAKVIKANGIRTIIDFGGFDKKPAANIRAQRTAESLGVTRYVLPLEGDATGDPNRYLDALRLLRKAKAENGGPVLMHCAAGSERTGCAVALYRIIENGWTIDAAIEEAMQYDHRPEKNPHLRRMIETYRDDIESALLDGGSVAWMPATDG